MPGESIDGVFYPSVTEVLAGVGLGWPPGLPSDDRAKALGKAVHAAIAFDLAGQAFAPLHPDVEPGVTAFRAFRAAVPLVPRAVEARLISHQLMVIGHPDFVGHVNGNGSLAIIDWKYTNSVDIDVARWQVAGYRVLWNSLYEEDAPVRNTYVVQLRKNGTFNLVDVTDVTATQTFLGAVHVWRALRQMRRTVERMGRLAE